MQQSIALNQNSLGLLPKNVVTPQYKRSELKTTIVHVGVGGFHRAHQALYTDQLVSQYGMTDCGICGVGLLDYNRKIYSVLKEQDGLYTLGTKEIDGSLSARVIGSIVEFLFAPDNPEAVIEKMAHPDIQIISMTITEGGYNVNVMTKEFDFTNPAIIRDLENPPHPKTIFGFIANALKRRKERDLSGCTILSCDNVHNNGKVAKKMFCSFIERFDASLLPWVEENVSFPTCMVDRITPVTVDADCERIKEQFHINDQWPVVCEPFIQWIIEDDFPTGRPAWEKVGVQFVKDVEPYENMKLRLLNAGHSVLGILGALHGYDTIDEVAADEDFCTFLRNFMDKEATPTILKNLEGIDLDKYKDELIARFQNIYIKDQISRICLESSAKMPIFLLPTLREQLELGGAIDLAVFVLAAWCKYNDGIDEKGRSYEIDDAMRDALIKAAARSHKEPIKFLEIEPIFGDLVKNKRFVDKFLETLETLRRNKIKDCVKVINAKKQ